MRHESFMSPGVREPHRVAYTEWGESDNPRVLVCVHGLTRNGRDFDTLAEALAGEYRVVCPDVVGRGASDWLEDKSEYGYPRYVADMLALIGHLEADDVHWVGTSMGGLIGMFLSALPESPITRMVMNDVGPFLPKAALQRIVAYVGEDPRFPDMEALDAYLRVIYAPFGPFTEDQWQGLVQSSARTLDTGEIGLTYDPGIAEPLRAMPVEDIDMWPVWDAISIPVLVIRGEKSDVLLAATAENMAAAGPGARLEVLPGIGHAPTLMSDDQITLIRDWFADV
jgi:pimeloyl-ACP methyl ester carboxylesterase